MFHRKIKGLHHITLMARDAQRNNAFFTGTLGLRRIKQTVNFDQPDIYHLYYGNEEGLPGTVMTYFPFHDIAARQKGTGEVGETAYAVPKGSFSFWQARLADHGVRILSYDTRFGEDRLVFEGPDGEELALVERFDERPQWLGAAIPASAAIYGFHAATLRLKRVGTMSTLLSQMGYEKTDEQGRFMRFTIRSSDKNGANFIDLEIDPALPQARQGAGSVHHIAFAIENEAAQDRLRHALLAADQKVTAVIDRDYFKAVYFRTMSGILFEIATDDPGFLRDEKRSQLGQALQLPAQHAHLRSFLMEILPPLD